MKTIPYFYIIKHKVSGKKYAGSRWALGCHPSELMKEDGYKTSSPRIHKIIDNEGIEAFEILQIIQLDNPYEFETRFLLENDCANSEEWFNSHNNQNRPVPYGSTEFKNLMIAKYGVSHNTLIPEVKQRMIDNARKTYKENPEMLKQRALKIAESKRKNGTTGKGVPKTHTNNGKTGKWKREQNHKLAISQRSKILFKENNPMNNPESRAKVASSKIGRKRIYREDGSFYMSKVDDK